MYFKYFTGASLLSTLWVPPGMRIHNLPKNTCTFLKFLGVREITLKQNGINPCITHLIKFQVFPNESQQVHFSVSCTTFWTNIVCVVFYCCFWLGQSNKKKWGSIVFWDERGNFGSRSLATKTLLCGFFFHTDSQASKWVKSWERNTTFKNKTDHQSFCSA